MVVSTVGLVLIILLPLPLWSLLEAVLEVPLGCLYTYKYPGASQLFRVSVAARDTRELRGECSTCYGMGPIGCRSTVLFMQILSNKRR